jgi:oxygen-dependent protoporphyrinogen oxidase
VNQSSGSNPLRIAVIGGGISGLAAAFYVRRLAPRASIQLFEAGPRVGGVVRTERHDGYLVECGPDNFITNVPWGTELCRRLGLDDQLIGTQFPKGSCCWRQVDCGPW